VNISHGVLEDVRRDPGRLRRPVEREPRSFSRARALQYAIYRYHDRGLAAAHTHLATTYHKNFKRPAGLRVLQAQLQLYHERFSSTGNVVLQRNLRLKHKLPGDHWLVGEIPRIDVVPASGGFALWLFSPTRRVWRNDLRMPILQQWLADRLAAGADDVTVGFYFLDDGVYESGQFPELARSAAQAELEALLP
jgi:hypothetical protein